MTTSMTYNFRIPQHSNTPICNYPSSDNIDGRKQHMETHLGLL